MIKIVISDDGMMEYSIMVLIKVDEKKKLLNRLLIEDYEEGDIHPFF